MKHSKFSFNQQLIIKKNICKFSCVANFLQKICSNKFITFISVPKLWKKQEENRFIINIWKEKEKENIQFVTKLFSLFNYICHTRRLLSEKHEELGDDNFRNRNRMGKYKRWRKKSIESSSALLNFYSIKSSFKCAVKYPFN